jgi:hypothetical protein
MKIAILSAADISVDRMSISAARMSFGQVKEDPAFGTGRACLA